MHSSIQPDRTSWSVEQISPENVRLGSLAAAKAQFSELPLYSRKQTLLNMGLGVGLVPEGDTRPVLLAALVVSPVSVDLKNWQPRPRPARALLEGRFVRLEPLNAASHGDDLFEIATVPDAADRFRYLSEEPPESRAAFQTWLEKVQASEDPLYFSVIDKASGKAAGRQTFMRIEPAHGRIEIGHIHWGPAIARKPAATEAHYLFMRHAFEDLGYRRWEWKCNNRNEPSKRAAERFGFKSEGVFRQHMIVKGENRDTAWYSIIDTEWPALKRAYEEWLNPANFDNAGQQRRRLEEIRAGL